MIEVSIDSDRCVASGQCALAAPKVFDQDDDLGISYLLIDPVPDEYRDDVEYAVVRCPAQAIRIVKHDRPD